LEQSWLKGYQRRYFNVKNFDSSSKAGGETGKTSPDTCVRKVFKALQGTFSGKLQGAGLDDHPKNLGMEKFNKKKVKEAQKTELGTKTRR